LGRNDTGRKLTSNNPNLGTIRKTIRDLGGTILGEVGSGLRHLRLRIRTKAGAELDLSVNLGKVDAKKQRDWVRQQLRKADAATRKR
jgi:hypothetical protein